MNRPAFILIIGLVLSPHAALVGQAADALKQATGKSPEEFATDETAIIKKAISDCLKVVHSYPAEPMNESFFKRFDAFYNTASGRVEDSGVYVGDQAPRFQFHKCMAQHGVPLK